MSKSLGFNTSRLSEYLTVSLIAASFEIISPPSICGGCVVVQGTALFQESRVAWHLGVTATGKSQPKSCRTDLWSFSYKLRDFGDSYTIYTSNIDMSQNPHRGTPQELESRSMPREPTVPTQDLSPSNSEEFQELPHVSMSVTRTFPASSGFCMS